MEKIVNQLDPSQTKAFNLAIHSRLAMIQGPPGTGKTFIGIKLASVILKAMISGPILVLTFKNHALDEFLKDMVDVCGLENILRIGGRCQEPILEGRNLKQVNTLWQIHFDIFITMFLVVRFSRSERKVTFSKRFGRRGTR